MWLKSKSVEKIMRVQNEKYGKFVHIFLFLIAFYVYYTQNFCVLSVLEVKMYSIKKLFAFRLYYKEGEKYNTTNIAY